VRQNYIVHWKSRFVEERMGCLYARHQGRLQGAGAATYRAERRHAATLFSFRYARRSEGNGGHFFGTTLSPEDKDRLLECLKPLRANCLHHKAKT